MDSSRCGRLQFSKTPLACSARIVASRSSYCPHATGESRGAEGGGGQLEVSAYPGGAWEEPRLQRLVEFRAAGKPPDLDLGVSGQEEIPWMHLPISALSPTGDFFQERADASNLAVPPPTAPRSSPRPAERPTT